MAREQAVGTEERTARSDGRRAIERLDEGVHPRGVCVHVGARLRAAHRRVEADRRKADAAALIERLKTGIQGVRYGKKWGATFGRNGWVGRKQINAR